MMKKITDYFKLFLIVTLLISCVAGIIVGTRSNYSTLEENITSPFVSITFITTMGAGDYEIKYDKETKVKYLFWYNGRQGGVTPLYNADGTLQLYEEEE